ncbi:MAG: hydantoinase B/oxoprolinase family protein [Alphaproteobacteria bacterium]|nr:hydantoinase B/oxoprolinase family protein [Alphaproteobacteria bacterium]
MKLDPADYAVISQALLSATREMGAKLMRSAYSTIVRDANDAAAALLDRRGRAVCQGEHNPAQLGSMSATIARCGEMFGFDRLDEGDFFITNDPYHGGQHLPDIFIFSPILLDGEVLGFAGTVAHHIDIGGGAPGLNMAARELIQEGLIIPPSRWNMARDWNGGCFQQMIAANIRVPEQTIGDINAQFAGNAIGAARVVELGRKYGAATVMAVMDEMNAYSERRMRAAIAAAPDGVYRGEDFIDDDGAGGGPVPIRCAVTIAGDRLAVDFAGTGGQVPTNMNCPFASTLASAYCCVKGVLTDPDTPFNAGSVAPISVTAPLGTILNPRRPAPVRARMTPVNRSFNAIMKALAQAVPERVIATGFDTTTGPYLSRRTEARYQVYHEIIGGGWGASARADGCSSVDGPTSNCANAPIEALDMDYDYFRVTEYAVIPGSGGAGKFRGGLGTRRRYLILKDGVQYAQYGDRFRFRPTGLFGGHDGKAARCTLTRDGETVELASKVMMELKTGDMLTVETGGGGGYGPPDERAGAAIASDAADGFVVATASP